MYVLLVYVIDYLTLFSISVELYGDHLHLHVLTHSFPTRRASDLVHSPRSRNDWEMDPAGVRHGIIFGDGFIERGDYRSEEHTSELQSLMRIPYAVICLKKNMVQMLGAVRSEIPPITEHQRKYMHSTW